MAKQAAVRTDLAHKVFNEVREYCVRNADPELSKKYAKYFTEGYDSYGLTDKLPDWTEKRECWASMLRDGGPAEMFKCGDLLMATGKFEEASFAIRFVIDLPEFDARENFDRIAKWFIAPVAGEYRTGIRNWAHSDILSGDALSRYLLNKIVTLKDLEAWRDSSHKFQRRTVPVSLCTPMNSKRTLLDQTNNYSAMLRLIEPLMSDTERVVHQGVGWFLRDAWKRYPEQIEPFLLKHKNTAPRLIYQYATEKMDKKNKERFRKK